MTTGVILRGTTLLYATLSLVVTCVAILLFCVLEVFSESRETWRRSSRWSEIHEGMTQQEVLSRLGEPFQRLPAEPSSGGREEEFVYQLHPLDALDGGGLAFSRNVAGEMTLSSKSPDDVSWKRRRSEWVPRGYSRLRYRQTIVETATILAFGGIILLGVLTLLPFGAKAGVYSWTLYTPLLALLLGVIYEIGASRGWRFDLMLLYPVYAVILIGWAVRMMPLVRARP